MDTVTAAGLALTWECISNFVQDEVFLAELTLENRGTQTLAQDGWALYFNTARRIVPDLQADTRADQVRFEHINGDLFRLRPLPGFAALAPGAKRAVRYRGAPWAISETDAPLGFYLVLDPDTAQARAFDLGDPAIVPFLRSEQCQRSAHDNWPSMTPERRFADNCALHLLPAAELAPLTPSPWQDQAHAGHCLLGRTSVVSHDDALAAEAGWLRACLAGLPASQPSPSTASEPAAPVRIRLSIDADGPPHAEHEGAHEAYRLVIAPAGITLAGASAHGVFNGVQSLRALIEDAQAAGPQEGDGAGLLRLACREIVDTPRFAYRGMMLDVARHFSSKDTVLHLLDCMARYKLNKFHLHATDDEGWRIEIAGLPELTGVGARRGVGADCLPPSFGSGAAIESSSGTGYYSRADFIDIVRHAAARHIEVIPELNLPGHARAAIVAMQARHARLLAEGQTRAARRYLLSDLLDRSEYESVQLWRDNVVCIGLPSCYRFIDTVVAELAAMYRAAGVVLKTIHIGGDEVAAGAWHGSPVCQALMARHGWHSVAQLRRHFLRRCCRIFAAHGVALAGWEEIALEAAGAPQQPARPDPAFVAAGVRPYVWNNAWGAGNEDAAYRLANAGYKIVQAGATALYFDLAHAKHPQEPGYYWAGFVELADTWRCDPLEQFAAPAHDAMGQPVPAPVQARQQRLLAGARANIAGLQGQLWGENARNRARVEYLALPRMIALAERAWARDPGFADAAASEAGRARIEHAWNEFANRLGQRELPRLDRATPPYGYRIAPPGVRWQDGAWHANLSTPGLTMHYTLDGREPSPHTPRYAGPVPAAPGAVFRIAAFNRCGRQSRSETMILNKDMQ